MQIANPIYDTVFKYMMHDSKIAKIILSAIIGEKIIDLDFSATETPLVLKKGVKKKNRVLEQITVCRIDFRAKIETPDGYKSVMIELQKAKLATDIMRFRKYLGVMYQSKDNTYKQDKGKTKEKARQIYCIYFLNYEIGLSDNPILKVDYTATDHTTGEQLPTESDFIKSLNHKSWIIQVRQLKGKRRNDLENLLSIFDQSNITNDNQVLSIDESQYPEAYKMVIRKLQEAYASEEVRNEMQIEDDFLNELLDRDELIAKQEDELTKQAEEITKKDEENRKQAEELTKQAEEIAELKRLLGK